MKGSCICEEKNMVLTKIFFVKLIFFKLFSSFSSVILIILFCAAYMYILGHVKLPEYQIFN